MLLAGLPSLAFMCRSPCLLFDEAGERGLCSDLKDQQAKREAASGMVYDLVDGGLADLSGEKALGLAFRQSPFCHGKFDAIQRPATTGIKRPCIFRAETRG